jgi:peptidoglycan/LPS O-acetylase OafA/YrhL
MTNPSHVTLDHHSGGISCRLPSRIQSLDGLRAVAIAAVIVGHTVSRTASTHKVNALGIALGGSGVTLFFVISGFIITHLLAEELRMLGRIDLRLFYVRRALRLWPALWSLIAAVGLLAVLGSTSASAAGLLPSIFFISDYITTIPVALAHTWSLAVEEQFYLLWPLVLVFGSKWDLRRVLIAAIVLAPVIRIASYFALPGLRGNYMFEFHCRYDALAVGCLIALSRGSGWRRALAARRHLVLAAATIASACTILVAGLVRSAAPMIVAGWTVQALALGAVVCLVLDSTGDWLTRILNARPLVHIGLRSYSLYLWQQLFLVVPFGPFVSTPIGLIATFVSAELSWSLIERPFVGLRRRLRPEPRSLQPQPLETL